MGCRLSSVLFRLLKFLTDATPVILGGSGFTAQEGLEDPQYITVTQSLVWKLLNPYGAPFAIDHPTLANNPCASCCVSRLPVSRTPLIVVREVGKASILTPLDVEPVAVGIA
jgi:hypothetical protein